MTIVPIKPLPPVDLPPLRQVGQPVRRVDALAKAVGATVYAGDFTLPNMLHARVLRSPYPSARIVRLDASRARALRGVVCVLTAADLADVHLVTDMPGQTGQKKRAGSDAPVLASDVVRFAGEPVALIAAETLDLAEQAMRLIEVQYEPLPGVFDPFDAMQPDAPIVNPPDNIVARWKIRKGDVDAGMAQADVVLENTFRMPFVDHAYIETESGVAWIDERDVINIRVSTQVVEHFRSIAAAVGVPHNKLRIQGAMVGGGFGGKEDITVEIFLGLLARRTRRPVRLVYTREESLLAHSKRHPMTITHRTGVTRDGRITAAEINIVADSGAYPYLSPYVLLYSTVVAAGSLPCGQSAGRQRGRRHQQPVYQRVPRLWRAAVVFCVRAADGCAGRGRGHGPVGLPRRQLPAYRRSQRHRAKDEERSVAGRERHALRWPRWASRPRRPLRTSKSAAAWPRTCRVMAA